jgi:hypothetical protein
VGGDLRIPHFVGLHGLQILPFIGWWLARKGRMLARFRESHRLALVWIAGMSYLGMLLLLTWQALRGQALIHPDFKTISVFGALIFAAGLAVWITTIHAFRSSEKVREVLCAGNSFRSSRSSAQAADRSTDQWTLGGEPRGGKNNEVVSW